MRLITHGNNRTELQYENGTCVFFSYQTPVAGYTPSESYVKTDKWYSSTTTRHVNKWLTTVHQQTTGEVIMPSIVFIDTNGKSQEFDLTDLPKTPAEANALYKKAGKVLGHTKQYKGTKS